MDSNSWPDLKHGDFDIKDFHFKDGNSLPKLKIHYRTLGKLKRDKNGIATNAVLILHGTTSSGGAFFSDAFAGKLFQRGQLLSAEEYFLVLPDNIGHGESTKPSNGLRAQFPRYGYTDMVRAQHMLLTEHLGVDHLRLVIGVSMGGMHTWMWASEYPDFMDALFPLASLPGKISGRNRTFRKHLIESIRDDPEFNGGNYKSPLRGQRTAHHVMFWMINSPLQVQKRAPDRESADRLVNKFVDNAMKGIDANDLAFAFDASWDYDPNPGLEDIKAPLTAVNSADDQLTPPELEILEKEIQKVEKGKAVVLPITDKTDGHSTHSIAECWWEHLAELLGRSDNRSSKAKL